MAECPYCTREMLEADSCSIETVEIEGAEHGRVRYGFERFKEDETWPRCGDCGTCRGGFHHPGCDMEECPVCGDQLISCDHSELATYGRPPVVTVVTDAVRSRSVTTDDPHGIPHG